MADTAARSSGGWGGSTVPLSNTGKLAVPRTTASPRATWSATTRRWPGDAAAPEGPAAVHGPVPGRDRRRADLPEERWPALPGLVRRVPRSARRAASCARSSARSPPTWCTWPTRPASNCTRCSAGWATCIEPDQLIFDLDPPDSAHFDGVRTAALRLREILDGDLGLTSFVKSTGSKGLHVQVPLNSREDFDSVREFARGVADVLRQAEPGLVTTEQRKDARGGLIYAGHDAQRLRADRGGAVLGPGPARPPRWRCRCTGTRSRTRPCGRTRSPCAASARGCEQLRGAGDPWAGMARHRYGLARPRRLLARLAAS